MTVRETFSIELVGSQEFVDYSLKALNEFAIDMQAAMAEATLQQNTDKPMILDQLLQKGK